MASSPCHRQRGFAIILVLWLLVLLSAIGLHLTARGLTELRIARNVDAAARAEALADSGVAHAVFAVGDPDPDRRWVLDGKPRDITVAGGRLVITVRDENSKINPNLAAEPLMAALLRQTGIEQNSALTLAAAIAARVRPPPGGPVGGEKEMPLPLESIDDLRNVPGMTADIVTALRPHISLYATVPVPNQAGIDAVVAAAVAMAQPQVGGESRVRANPTDGPDKPARADKVTVAILCEASNGRDGAVFVRDAVVRLDSSLPKGYVALRWGRGDAASR